MQMVIISTPGPDHIKTSESIDPLDAFTWLWTVVPKIFPAREIELTTESFYLWNSAAVKKKIKVNLSILLRSDSIWVKFKFQHIHS